MDELKAPSLQSLLESDRSTDSLFAESLQLDVEDLDDTEYSIPPTELPTLESVLSEFEIESDDDDEDDDISDIGANSVIPSSTPDFSEDGALRNGGTSMGSIMRYNLMQGISAQISSAADRVNAGLASACAVSAQIAIGTSHGHILNFDVTQTLRWAYQDKNGQGAVSTLSFNPECTRLLVGFARGLIIMMETQSGNVLRSLYDVITPNTGVLHVKWTSRAALAVCGDSGGSVWSLSFTRKLGIRGCSSRCLFSGARGEVCAVEPLIMNNHEGQHELDQYSIVALATLSKYFIVTIRPRLKVIKYHALNGPHDCLPLLAWHMVLIQAADTSRSVDPVIVIARGHQIYFHQLFMSNGRISLLFLRHVEIKTNLLSAHWLGPKCVAVLDTSEILHLIDVRSSKELECMDMANTHLVYGSAQFKGLATGGNVSPALAMAGTHACYNSLTSRGSQLYILGPRSLHMIGVRSWSERISYLVKNQRWQEACEIALEGYRLTGERPKRKVQAKERIIMLFNEYLAAFSRLPDYCLGSVMNCIIAIEEFDLLWTKLWDRLIVPDLFLRHLSQHIENDRVKYVNPVISQALVRYWLDISPLKLEELILKLDWTCLDLNQVLKAAKRYQLYRAQIYLNTHALNDYSISLTELIPLVKSEHTNLGNCLLVYISSCLAGRGYPTGDIPIENVQNVKHEVLRCLTSLHSTSSEANELPYPYLRSLLKFDTRETLNVISLAFQEKEFNGELGLLHRKRIVYILLEVMTPENATWAEIGCLLNFIAQQISLQCLPRDTQLLEKVLNYLAKEEIAYESVRQHSERESAWHELLVNNCLEEISCDVEQLELARRARCYYVVEYLYEKLQQYDNILECYINNQSRHETLFVYVERHIGQPERKIYQQIKNKLKQLLIINPKETTRIIDVNYSEQLDELLSVINDDKELLFIFLQNLHKRHANMNSIQYESLLELLCQREPNAVNDFLKTTDVYRNDRALEIVTAYNLTEAAIYVCEQQKDFRRAFDLSMQLLAIAEPNELEERVQVTSSLCARASVALPSEQCEIFWFELLQTTLPREDLKSITKSMLHEASQHVDLTKLVQLVMSTANVSGNFGDIKTLLMSMLHNSRYETKALDMALKILNGELHVQFAKRREESSRGLWITMMRCVLCHNRLFNQTPIRVSGCGHSMHESCAISYYADVKAKAKEKNLKHFDSIESAENPEHQMNGKYSSDGDGDGDKSRTDFEDDQPTTSKKAIALKKSNAFKCVRCLVIMPDNFFQNETTQTVSNANRNVSSQNYAASSHINHYRIDETNRPLGQLPLKAPPKKLN